MAKGGDWGMDEAMKRIPAARLDAQVRMHKQANYTIIRNWVGQSTSEDFYEACDKYGILVWDEFFQPNPSDGPNPDDAGPLPRQRPREDPALPQPPLHRPLVRAQRGLPAARPLTPGMPDADRPNWSGSATTSAVPAAGRGVRSGGPYYWRTPREYYNVDAPFKTEIGSVSVPTLEAVQAMMPAKDWNVINDDWAEHDLARGAQGGDWYPRSSPPATATSRAWPTSRARPSSPNYEAFRAMYEGREAKLFHPATGVITWMSNPAQPSFVWQLYSWDLEPNCVPVRHPQGV